MKKAFSNYLIMWITLVVVFNVVIFVLPNFFAGFNKFGGAFWGSYAFVMLAFIGQLGCIYLALQAKNKEKMFLNLPIVDISSRATVLSVLVAILCFIIPDLPNWVAVILCVIILGVNAISITKANLASDLIENVDKKVKVQTFFVKSLTVDVQDMVGKTSDADAKEAVKKLAEKVRFSDPMSNDMLAGIESEIILKSAELKKAVSDSDADKIKALAGELSVMMDNRNAKCKLLK